MGRRKKNRRHFFLTTLKRKGGRKFPPGGGGKEKKKHTSLSLSLGEKAPESFPERENLFLLFSPFPLLFSTLLTRAREEKFKFETRPPQLGRLSSPALPSLPSPPLSPLLLFLSSSSRFPPSPRVHPRAEKRRET